MAFFNQPNADREIQGRLKKYPVVMGTQSAEAAMRRNFAAPEKKDHHGCHGCQGGSVHGCRCVVMIRVERSDRLSAELR